MLDKNDQPNADTNAHNANEQVKDNKPAEAAPVQTIAQGEADNSEPMYVDVFGTRIPIPVEQARDIIARRDASKEQLRSLEAQLEQHARAKEDAERRAAAAEAARNGDLEQAEARFSERFASRIDKMQRAVVRSSIQAALKSNPLFIGDDASTEDALSLLAAQPLVVDEATLVVKTPDGKTVNDVVQEFIASRPHMRRVGPGVRTNRGAPAAATTAAAPAGRRHVTLSLGDAIAKRSDLLNNGAD